MGRKPAASRRGRTGGAGRWDLSELVGPKKEAAHMRAVKKRVAAFAKSRARLRPSISAKELLGLVSKLEAIHEQFGLAASHASLSYAADTQSEKATARAAATDRLAAQIANDLLFFGHWWKLELDGRNARRLLGGLGDLAGYFAHMRAAARYTLPEPQERIINIMDVTGSSALVRIYDKITSGFRYRVGSREMGREELTALVRSPRAPVRRAAYTALLSKFAANRGVLADIYSSVVSEWGAVEVGLRSFSSPISARNMANDIDDRTVEALLASCKKNAGLFRRFFAAKARMLGLERIRRYDLYAPASRRKERHTYAGALGLVLAAMSEFDPKMAAMARRLADERHIDSGVRPGKRDGAFCSTVSPGITPYVLLSFAGTREDVFTLAHELGHAVHSVAASSQSILTQSAPLPVAETASTFSEMLLYDHLVRRAGAPQRRALLASKLDSLYATIARQSFFTLFEIDAHGLVAGGADASQISDAYMANLGSQFGRSVEVSADFAGEWAAIPHFYHAPFYCYAYAFGNLMALSLFSRYKREGPSFSGTYLDILGAGGSEKPEDLMSARGFDISRGAFWQEGFDYVRSQLGELERELE